MLKFSSLFAEDDAGGSPAEPTATSDEPVSNKSDEMATTGYGLKKKVVTRESPENTDLDKHDFSNFFLRQFARQLGKKD